MSRALAERHTQDPSQLSQLLRQRATGSNRVVHFTTSTESDQSVFGASVPAAAIPDHAVPSPFDSRRVATSSRHVQPALPTHHSAPTSTGFVKETADGALKMHHSFSGLDAPGDTQPDSQLYRDYTSGVHGTSDLASMVTSKLQPPKSLFTEHEDDDEGDSPTDDVEFVESSQPQQESPNVTSPTVIHDDDVLGESPSGNYAPTSPLKFETPGMAGRKRDSSGQMLSSAARTNITPGTVVSAAFAFADLGGGLPKMSLTQLYGATQAPTSPVLAEVFEDAAFTRPSPNFTQARHTSPILALSSPIKAMQSETPRTDPAFRSSSEPRAEYVSMKESQERRRRTTRDQPVQLVEEDSWETPTVVQLRLQKKKQRENLERRAAMSFANVSAPAPAAPTSPMKRKGAFKTSFAITSKTSRRTVAAHGGEDELAAVMRHNGTGNSVQVPKTSSHPVRTQSSRTPKDSSQDATPSSQLQRESNFHAPAIGSQHRDLTEPQSSKGSIAVMDSQPDATADYDSIPRPKSLRYPSSPSTNQYSINQTTMGGKTGYTNQVISSSMPPMPPRSSQDQDEEQVVPEEEVTPEDENPIPSSPPLIGPEDAGEKQELVYDEHEHGYDEYNEMAGVRDSVEPLAVNGDVEMAEDEDLPVAEPEHEQEQTAGSQPGENEDGDELDLVQPQKVDLEEDEEVPETLEQDGAHDTLSDPDDLPHISDPSGLVRDESMAAPQPPRMQRQNTVPETDALEETQPSHLQVAESTLQDSEMEVLVADELGAPHQTNSTEPFHTAREDASGSQDDQPPPASSREVGSDTIQANERLRSLQDIYNLPETQQEEEIEMPRLSGLDENEEDAFLSNSSPAPPSAKRRKVTYTAKRKIFRSPLKSMAPADVQMDQLPSSPLDQARAMQHEDAPVVSTQDREQQGALAAGQAREGAEGLHARQAKFKSKAVARPPKAQNQKKGALKPVGNVEKLLSSALKSPSKPNGIAEGRRSTPVTPSRRRLDGRDIAADVVMPDVNEERDELADTTPEPPEPADDEAAIVPITDHGEEPVGNIIMPNRVLASWPGSHFYPATCLGRVVGRQLQVRFDDGNTTSLDATQVRALDLRPGDLVKVDVTGMKRHTYVVLGFKDKVEDVGGEELLTTDRLGYATVVLGEKTRDSLPSAEAVQAAAKPIAVPIGSIYLTTQLWTRLRDRLFSFSPPASPTKSASFMGTPVSAVDPIITPSFTRRGTTAPSLLKDVTTRAASVASSSARSGTGVFSNMAFVLTSTATDVDKDAIEKIIKTQGGQVLDKGFHELFDYESADAPPSSHGRRNSTSVAGGSAGLSLKPAYQDLGFVALISDSFSRSTKYMQALALNVPCLHLRWVNDSLSASRAAPFSRYLLPAGVSKFLDPNGVVRSRTMNVYDPAAEDMSFAQVLSDRDLLLQGQTVLLVTGKSKKETEKRQPFVFLTHALGAANVGRCADLTSLADGEWDWIYVDNGEAGVADAAAELFGTGGKPFAKGKKGKKRKRDETEEKEELVARGMVDGKKVKITCSEFVIQSLILGALVEE